MSRRLFVALVVVLVAVSLSVAAPTTAATCDTGGFLPHPTTGAYMFPERTGTNEDGEIDLVTPANSGVSGYIHDNGEVVDHRLPPEYRAVHYMNCWIVAGTLGR